MECCFSLVNCFNKFDCDSSLSVIASVFKTDSNDVVCKQYIFLDVLSTLSQTKKMDNK